MVAEKSPIIVEFYGIPRQRAGCAQLAVQAGTVAELLAAVEKACPDLKGLTMPDGNLAKHYLLSINGEHFVSDLSESLQPGDSVLVLSADAGG